MIGTKEIICSMAIIGVFHQRLSSRTKNIPEFAIRKSKVGEIEKSNQHSECPERKKNLCEYSNLTGSHERMMYI